MDCTSIALTVRTPEETQKVASCLAPLLTPPAILLLQGNLGSGKTTFVQALGKSLGITSPITSPTFTLIDEYLEGITPLYHIDLYRLDPIAVPNLHLSVYWEGEEFPPGIVAIEWADRLPQLPPEYLLITFTYLAAETSRKITLCPQGKNFAAIVTQLQAMLSPGSTP